MKEFDLQAALAGEPVVLRDDRKAWVIYDARANSEVRGVAPIFEVFNCTLHYIPSFNVERVL